MGNLALGEGISARFGGREPLHHPECDGRDEDFARMERMIAKDSACLERPQVCFNYYMDEEDDMVVERISVPPLHAASRMGHYSCIEFLVEKGANVNSVHKGMTPISLHFMDDNVALDNDLEIIYLLLDCGAQVSGQYAQHGFNIVSGAVKKGREHILQAMIHYGAPIENLNPITGEPINNVSPLRDAFSKRFKMHYAEILLLHGGAKFSFPKNRKPFQFECVDQLMHGFRLQEDNPVLFILFLEMVSSDFLKFFKLYQAFGGPMWITYRQPPLNQEQDLVSYINDKIATIPERRPDALQIMVDMRDNVTQMVQNPLSLQFQTRIAVRKAMGRDMMKNIEHLPLPEPLKSFMEFEDVMMRIRIFDDLSDVLFTSDNE